MGSNRYNAVNLPPRGGFPMGLAGQLTVFGQGRNANHNENSPRHPSGEGGGR